MFTPHSCAIFYLGSLLKLMIALACPSTLSMAVVVCIMFCLYRKLFFFFVYVTKTSASVYNVN